MMRSSSTEKHGPNVIGRGSADSIVGEVDYHQPLGLVDAIT